MILGKIEKLFHTRGDIAYLGEPVTQLEHALQTAALAQSEGAAPELVTACLLHDLGHLLKDYGQTPTTRGIDDRHPQIVAAFLKGYFDEDVIEPLRLHVEAKRYLCHQDPDYASALSADSVRSLALQGGPHSADEARLFASRPHALRAVQLRRWDDRAKCANTPTPTLTHFLEIAAMLAKRTSAA